MNYTTEIVINMKNRTDGNNNHIACVIVTFNRKQLLKRCLEAVASQSLKPATVYITDNASTDGTIDSVKKWGYYNCEKNSIQYKYILNTKNEGGAGGFYLGMKTAFEDDCFDGIWVMDDDGIPDKECLSLLSSYLDRRDYIAPFVLSVDNPEVGFGIYSPNYNEVKQRHPNGVIENDSAPFNGILFSSRLIAKIGYPKREMFIWGDEFNYHMRAIKAGMLPITILDAKHYHPSDRRTYFEYRGKSIADIGEDWKLYCFLRNTWYNDFLFSKFKLKTIIKSFSKGILYYISYKKKGRRILLLVFDAFICALTGNFDRLSNYK